MMEKGKVSIIIPTYKGSARLRRAIDSALKQTYKNTEIIVVDDNGKDMNSQIATQKMLADYIEVRQISYIVHEVNKNGSAARNTGFHASKGEYICFLDDDDIFTEDKLQKQVDVLSTCGDEYGLCYCSIESINPGNIRKKTTATESRDILYNFFMEKLPLSSSNIMVRRAAFAEINGFDESFIRHQDWEMIARLLSKYKAVALNDICVIKDNTDRRHPKSAQLFEQYRLYYYQKMIPVIQLLSQEQQKDVKNWFCLVLAKIYATEGNIKKVVYYAGKSNQKVYTFLFSICYAAYIQIGKLVR